MQDRWFDLLQESTLLQERRIPDSTGDARRRLMPDTEAPIANGSNESGIGVDMITTPNGVVARGTIEMWAGDRVKPFRAVALAPWPEVLDHAPPAALFSYEKKDLYLEMPILCYGCDRAGIPGS